MNETLVTLVGNVAREPVLSFTPDGVAYCRFRMASTARRRDRASGAWVDAETLFVSVTAWRQLAEHVAESISQGDPVVAVGRLSVSEWTGRDGAARTDLQVTATSVGVELSRGTARFVRTPRSGGGAVAEDAPMADTALSELESLPAGLRADVALSAVA